MATEFSDIYLDGTNFEELYAGGGQIVEAWLNGECIWRLVDKLKYWKQIYSWTRYKGVGYGSGIYAIPDENPNWTNQKEEKVFFGGDDVSNMLFTAPESYLPWGKFPDGEIIAAYDFGVCIFSTYISNSYTQKKDVKSTGTLDIKNFVDDLKPVNNFLDDTLINITHPIGTPWCNIFSKKYHIYTEDHYITVLGTKRTVGKIVIENVIDNTVKEVIFDKMINNEYYLLRGTVFFKGKIYSMNSHASNFKFNFFTALLFYIDGIDDTNLKYIDAPTPFLVNRHVPYGMDANDTKLVWTCLLSGKRFETGQGYIDEQGLFLYEYDGADIIYKKISDALTYTYGVKIVGNHIVMFRPLTYHNNKLVHYGICAGKSINNMHDFTFSANDYNLNYGSVDSNKCDSRPRVFYEEDGELFFDIIYTQSKAALTGYNGSSSVLKMKLNFETGKIDEVSRIEINGSWEE